MRATPLLVLCLWLLGACGALPREQLGVHTEADEGSVATALPQAVINAAEAESLLLSQVYEQASPAVLHVEVWDLDGGRHRGSGFVYDRSGHIISNAHLVSRAGEILVTLGDGKVFSATVRGADSFSDLAVLKIAAPATALRHLRIGDSTQLKVGHRSIVIGNPFGLGSAMTTGIISGLGRSLPAVELTDGSRPDFENPDIIQIDSSIHPGNSGAPLLDERGLVMGIVTAIRSDDGRFQGVAFAVPAATMRRVIPELIRAGHVSYPWLGISVMREAGGYGVAGLSAELGLPVARGVLLRGVSAGSPAHRAGLRGGDRQVELRGESVCTGGDIIIAINDQHIEDLGELISHLVQKTAPGDDISLLFIRERETVEVTLTLTERGNHEGTVLDCTQAQPDG